MIVAGFSYYGAHVRRGERPLVEVAVVGNGDRAHLDALVARAPEEDRQVVIEFFRPFVEGGRPDKRGAYTYRTGAHVVLVWWKECEVLP